jgi:cytoskeletal protein RodZ
MDRQDKYPSRMTKRKDKKVNKVYNILITVVVLLIIAVGATIFLGNSDEPASQKANTNPESNQSASNDDKEEDNNEDTVTNEDEQSSENEGEESQDQEQESSDSEEDTDTVESEKVEETASDGNVEEAYSDPSWKPVGTEQSGEHVTQYEKGSTDWNEMERAIAYGAGIDQSNMTLWYLQNGGEPNKAIGTVSPTDGSSTYRVYIEWVDGEGWKPTKVEKLIKNDKAS